MNSKGGYQERAQQIMSEKVKLLWIKPEKNGEITTAMIMSYANMAEWEADTMIPTSNN